MRRSTLATTATPSSEGWSARESYVEVKDVPGPTGESQLWVRLKPTASKKARTR